uniref:probable ubiquitin-conjugating enzyme E2 25 n=1 Tax=Erigeron canadensis TaxID=72917 RepID=UPI001CB8B4DD|nr:probable ubiquitin-conjugating enzyme E2 25 [Erigeron canadensis]
MYECGTVCLSLPKTNGGLEPMWSPGSSTMLQLLVAIQNRFLNAKPLFNDPTYALMRDTQYGEQASFQYNEMTLIKSLKTMLYTMIRPPKNFEDFVAGHFHNHGRGILVTTCNKKPCSVTFKNELARNFRPVAAAFAQIGAVGRTILILKLKEDEVILEMTEGTICPNTPSRN